MKSLLRVAKWTAFAFLLLVTAWIVVVLIRPAARYEIRFEVDRPIDVAWRVFTDEERTDEWLQGLKSMETISGERMTVGSRHRLVFDEDGKTIEMEEEVLSVVEGKEFGFRLTHPMIESELLVRFEDLGGERTRIVTENEVRGKGFIAPIIPLLKSSFIERQEEGYAALKAMIESE